MCNKYSNSGFVVIFFSVCMIACDNKTSAGNENKSIGQNLYEQNCVICHGKDGKLKASSSKDLSESVLSKELVIQAIQKGSPQGGMPSYENRLKPNEIEEISEYVLKLRK